MATRRSSRRKAGTSSKASRSSLKRRSSTVAEVAGPAPMITAAERRQMAQEEACWRAESDLHPLRQAEEIQGKPANA